MNAKDAVKQMEQLMLNQPQSTETQGKESAGKPCRACVDFKSWTKKMTTSKDPQPKQEAAITDEDPQCPLDSAELGRNTWGFLHSLAAYYPEKPTNTEEKDMKQFIRLFSKFYPCDYCAIHLRERLKTDIPDTQDNVSLSRWFCGVHNEVNERLGKPKFDCTKVMERWKDGWADGSCD